MKFLNAIKEYMRESLEWHFISFLIEGSVLLTILGKLWVSLGIVLVTFILKIIIYCIWRKYVKE